MDYRAKTDVKDGPGLMRVLVGCEYSNTVAGAFREAGHRAWSCDLLPSEGPEAWHWQGDVMRFLSSPVSTDEGCFTHKYWDLIILHPPCTYLAVSGNRWYAGSEEREQAAIWTKELWDHACKCSERVALENPVGYLSTFWRPPNQYIQPWQFGHGETKKTGLWLHNLPELSPTDVVEGREGRVWKMPPSPDRGKERSRFYPGFAKAMAQQWGQATP